MAQFWYKNPVRALTDSEVRSKFREHITNSHVITVAMTERPLEQAQITRQSTQRFNQKLLQLARAGLAAVGLLAAVQFEAQRTPPWLGRERPAPVPSDWVQDTLFSRLGESDTLTPEQYKQELTSLLNHSRRTFQGLCGITLRDGCQMDVYAPAQRVYSPNDYYQLTLKHADRRSFELYRSLTARPRIGVLNILSLDQGGLVFDYRSERGGRSGTVLLKKDGLELKGVTASEAYYGFGQLITGNGMFRNDPKQISVQIRASRLGFSVDRNGRAIGGIQARRLSH